MSAERRNLPHAGRVLSRIENGHNTTPVRYQALTLMQKGVLAQGSQFEERLIEDLTRSWRHLGPVEDSQLDSNYSPPKTSKKVKQVA